MTKKSPPMPLRGRTSSVKGRWCVCNRSRSDPGHTPEDCRVTLGIPLLARGDVLGILTLRDLSEVWAKHDRAPFLEALANLAAHALHNDSLYRDLLRQKDGALHPHRGQQRYHG